MNERLRVGFIGCAGQGQFNLRMFMEQREVDIVAVCDVDRKRAAEAQAVTDCRSEVVEDYRRVLDRPDVDVVVINTPDHWHAIPTIEACQTGKDVYVEKPMTHRIAEGRRMVEAARRYDRVVQCGTQQRSGEHYAEVREIVRSGVLGHICHVRVWNLGNRWPGIRHPGHQAVPATFKWDLWLGPAPWREYDPVRASGLHRFYWDYAGGTVCDWGTHHMDTIQWIMDVTAPRSVVAVGGDLGGLEEPFETPNTLNAIWEYDGWTLAYEIREASHYAGRQSFYGIVFHGTDAALLLDRSGYEIIPEGDRAAAKTVGTPGVDNFMPEPLTRRHVRNFLDCVVSRERPVSDVEIGHRSTTVPHLANISYKVGRRIRWDADSERVIDDPEANALLTKEYRAPYVLPDV